MSSRAAKFAEGTDDPTFAATLADAPTTLATAESRLAALAAPPMARETTSRGMAALVAALPPLERVS